MLQVGSPDKQYHPGAYKMQSLRLHPDPIVLKTVFFPITLGTGITLSQSHTAHLQYPQFWVGCNLCTGVVKTLQAAPRSWEVYSSESLLSLTSENEVVQLSISLLGWRTLSSVSITFVFIDEQMKKSHNKKATLSSQGCCPELGFISYRTSLYIFFSWSSWQEQGLDHKIQI